MSLLLFWVVAIYVLGYGAFFVTMFPINERLLSGGQQLTWRTYWPALFWTMGLSLPWPWFLYRHWRDHART